MEAVFQDCIREVKAEGRTVLLSSHILAEVEALCDRVSIIRLGRTEQSGTLQEMRHLTRTSITVELKAPAAGLDLPGVHGLEVHDSLVRFDVDSEHLGEVVRRLGELGVTSLVSRPPTLEELFLRHYGDELAREPGRRTSEAAPAGDGRA
jgi:ABC-2 type transport system ATP-binding protein